MFSTSSAVLVDSPSDSSERGCTPSLFASETSSVEPSLPSTGLVSPALTTFTTLTQTDWVGSDESISSVVASLASPSPSPETRKRIKTTATSGRKCAASLHSKDPLGLLAKMLLASSRWHSTMCFLTWKISATPRGRLLFRLVPSMRDTAATESGLWATPQARDHMPAHRPEYIAAKKAQGHGMRNLNDEVALWPTPTWRDSSNTRNSTAVRYRESKAHAGTTLVDAVVPPGGGLNPAWVEWLMGYPDGWTDLGPSAMPSSRKSSMSSEEP